MASKLLNSIRTWSPEDLRNASDDEMDELLATSDAYANEYLVSEHATSNSQAIANPSIGPIKNGIRVGPIIAPGTDSPENDDFFLHGPQAPVLNLDNPEITNEIEPTFHRNEVKTGLPRSKSVRFEDLERSKKFASVREQVGEVTEKMKENVNRLLDREASFGSLSNLSDQLRYSNDIYRQSSDHLRRKIFWRQQRTRLVLGAVFVVGIFLLIIPVITKLLQ